MDSSVVVYTLRTICVTEHQWIARAETTMEDDSIESVTVARAENLLSLQRNLSTAPPMMFGRIPSTWREPYEDMKVTVEEKIIKQDLMTGDLIYERGLEAYTIPYKYMGT